jgi:hypothetical protein
MAHYPGLTRRSAFILITCGTVFAARRTRSAEQPVITVHLDPNCGCCSGWVRHLKAAGFTLKTVHTGDLDAVKTRLGVPADLAACHTAEVAGYVVEGHVPALAVKRLLAEKPNATGLAVPGMPSGSPGMPGGTAEEYEVVLFGPAGRRSFMRFLGDNVFD